jgi:hypothetical protein
MKLVVEIKDQNLLKNKEVEKVPIKYLKIITVLKTNKEHQIPKKKIGYYQVTRGIKKRSMHRNHRNVKKGNRKIRNLLKNDLFIFN